MIFKKTIFNKITKEELYKEKMNGFNDESLKDYSFLSSSSLYKEKIQQNAVQQEYIEAYMKSAEILLEEYNQIIQKENVMIKVLMPVTPLSIPIIYICRHSMELSIKYAIYRLERKQITIHGLVKIWEYLIAKLDITHDEKIINNMGEFVQYMEEIDIKSTRLRYPLGEKNITNQKTPLFVNCSAIVKSTREFVNQIYTINFDQNGIN